MLLPDTGRAEHLLGHSYDHEGGHSRVWSALVHIDLGTDDVNGGTRIAHPFGNHPPWFRPKRLRYPYMKLPGGLAAINDQLQVLFGAYWLLHGSTADRRAPGSDRSKDGRRSCAATRSAT
jgi:hypothetical protein